MEPETSIDFLARNEVRRGGRNSVSKRTEIGRYKGQQVYQCDWNSTLHMEWVWLTRTITSSKWGIVKCYLEISGLSMGKKRDWCLRKCRQTIMPNRGRKGMGLAGLWGDKGRGRLFSVSVSVLIIVWVWSFKLFFFSPKQIPIVMLPTFASIPLLCHKNSVLSLSIIFGRCFDLCSLVLKSTLQINIIVSNL